MSVATQLRTSTRREIVGAPFLEVPKAKLDGVLGSLTGRGASSPQQRLELDALHCPSQTFYDSTIQAVLLLQPWLRRYNTTWLSYSKEQ